MSESPIIDACVHHHWDSQLEVMEYMSRGWQEYLRQPSSLPGDIRAIPALPHTRYRHPEGDEHPDARSPGPGEGSRCDLLRRRLLDGAGVDRAVLVYDHAMVAPLAPSPYLARDLVRAANDWTRERWLEEDDRLYGVILAATQSPGEAAAEIRRLGGSPRFVGVLIAANGLARPFGHPIYHPIFEAAVDHDLPVVIHTGGDAVSEVLSHPTAGGLPTSYADYAVLRPQALMTHLASLIAQGVFAKFPGLRVIAQGAGVAWVPSLFWRFDTLYRSYRRETPWVTRPPTDYLRDHIWICTNPLDVAPAPGAMLKLLDSFGGLEDRLVYGSGYPHREMDWPADVAEQLPVQWRSRVFGANALDAFRWTLRSAPREPAVASVGEMDERTTK